jgi:TolB-like protein
MSSAGIQPAPPRPSVFISYASEDRTAARALRDALEAAGLDVWYDESELGGGDAWDQKIRRQIRDCDYFMPLISAATEARKEGYFRREWRLATERTMDMADDVLFLLPIALDDTHEAGARVPEKFLHVQWLRLPDGQPTPALESLVRRLLAGEHRAPPRPAASVTRPPMAVTRPPLLTPTQPPFTTPPAAASTPPPEADPSHPHAPPPMPPVPPAPEKGGFAHGLKYAAEISWWVLTVAWLLFKRLPRWLRILLSIWIVMTFFARCGRDNPAPAASKPARVRTVSPEEVRRAIQSAAEKVAASSPAGSTDLKSHDLFRIGREIARTLAKDQPADGAAGKPVVIVPFAQGIADEVTAKFATAVFASCYGQMLVARPGAAAIAEQPSAIASNDALAALGKGLGAEFVLAAELAVEAGPRSLAVRLLRVRDSTPVWSDSFPIADTEPSAAAEKITENVLGFLAPR